ncbi:MAG: hypothetical protein A2Z02_03230 [Chloroflexi bacterium RBG_16_48_7]|nr:MAG: hypothetical protein A2Z02_03230 [Chloroflexi bacterium RBG_16_48_7]
MNKKWYLVIALGLISILAMTSLAGCGNPATTLQASTVQISSQQQGIWVTGIGELSVKPDIAVLSVGIVAQEKAVAVAQSKATEAINRVMKSLTDSGIAEKDIQTGSFSINQQTRWDDQKQIETVTGYRITNMLTVKVRAMDKIGFIIDSTVQAGGDLIRINNISFSVEEPSRYYQQVREKAMTAAKNKAEELARLGGVKLGKPTYITENAEYTPMYRAYANVSDSIVAPAAMGTTPISAGETKITLNIQVAYSTN